MLNEQTIAPDFSLPDQNDSTYTLSAQKGNWVLLYFYPKDDTPGCTKEACAMRDNYSEFTKRGVKVFGVSADKPESHKKFEKKYDLNFTLLSDVKKEVLKAYGADGLVRRISYLIDPNGIIFKAYAKVKPAEHAMEILADLPK